jgi:diguanylate cyclase (GGDEF)-like protein
MFSSIRTKFTVIIALVSMFALACVYMAIAFFYGQNLDMLVQRDLKQSEHLVKEQVRLDTNKLGAALEVLTRDRILAETFKMGDRNRLFELSRPIYESLETKYGITHLYFHLTDGTVFLRVHKRAQYGDKIDRKTFQQARRTGNTSSGLELGKTAFALRIVSPMYLNGELIGYLELGEEIDHFLGFLKEATGNEFAMVVEKQRVDQQQLSKVLGLHNQQGTWNRMQDFVSISPSVPSIDSMGCMNDRTLHTFSRRSDFDRTERSQTTKICGGFPIKDANGESVGALVTLIDVSQQARMLTNLRRYSILLVLLLFASTFVTSILLARRYIISPIGEISRAARIFATGDLKEHRISINSKDEIGMLAESINEMAMQLDQHYSTAIDRSVELEQLNRSLEALATTDGLTGLYNHRYFYQKLVEEIARSRRYNHPLSLIMADLDHFKQYNDANGHLSGDTLLRKISVIFLECSRDIDVVARYGGEEFVIILPETELAEAHACAERIRTRIASTVFPHAASLPEGRVTVSFGVSCLSDQMKDVSDFVENTDQALYRAKDKGRNRVET